MPTTRTGEQIRLDNARFKSIGHVGELKGKFFHQGKHAHDANDRIIYHKHSGDVFYDGNGNEAGGKTLFAKVAPGTDLDHHDFFVI